MATPCIPSALPAMDKTLGAAFVGNIAAAIFYGITNLQTFTFYQRSHDGLLLQGLIFVLWVLDSLHIILVSHAIYFYAVTNFSNALAMLDTTWSIMVHVMITGVSDVIIRGVYRLSNGWLWLTAAIMTSSALVFGGSIAFAVRGLQLGTYAELSKISWILYTAFGAGVFVDCLIAVSLCALLAWRRTGIKRTDSIVRVLIMYSINTGALTSLCAIVVLVTYATMPTNFVYIAFYFVLPKLFFNSLLATLNARKSLQALNSNTPNIVSIPLTSVLNAPTSKTTPSYQSTQPHVEIEIHTTVDRRTDSLADLQMSQDNWKGPYNHD